MAVDFASAINEIGTVILTGPDFNTAEIIPTASPYPPGVRSAFHSSSNALYLATGKEVTKWHGINKAGVYQMIALYGRLPAQVMIT